MTEMVQSAARRLKIATKTVGQGLHTESLLAQRLLTNYPVITLSWPGADANAHLPTDTVESLDPEKIKRAGRLLSLTTAVMATDPGY